MCRKKNWRTVLCMAVLIVCDASSVQSAARWASQYSAHDSDSDAVEKTADKVEKAASDAVEKTADEVEKAASDAVGKTADKVEKAASDAAGRTADEVEKAASDAAGRTADEVEKAASDAVGKTADKVEKAASDAAGRTADEVEKAASDAAGRTADEVEKAASDAVEKTADEVEKAASDAAGKTADEVEKAASDAAGKTADKVEKAASDADDSVHGIIQDRESILEKQEVLFKDYDLDKLLQSIQRVLEHNSLKNVQEQFHKLFETKDSSIYSCALESAALDKNLQTVKEGMAQELSTEDNQNSVANVKSLDGQVKSHDYESYLQEIHNRLQKANKNLQETHKDAEKAQDLLKEAPNRLEKTHEERDPVELHQGKDRFLLSSKALYKKGYDFILSANYVEAEKTFCTFQQHYKKDPLNNDALFWLAEALFGQKRYYEAAQVYLNAWYADKKKLYTSEILLKLARSMITLEKNKKVCETFAKRSKYSKTLESVFCKPLKESGAVRGVR
ncbi:TolA-binding protein [Bartonella callosciuri]|uniref:TolA-binding protein n=1 Tax=Bartonella callosciuri TaxID=686223 RepID=A0A840NXT4_9HYPH|nr:hypothetical protein [Bartonella callosciuri]MBB5074142.1 TolA-binding protein [Bartonella callosciuri]